MTTEVKVFIWMYAIATFTVTNIHWYFFADKGKPFVASIGAGVLWPVSGIVVFAGNIFGVQ